VLAFRQRDSFLYWPFLVSTLLIAMLAWRIGYARGSAENPSGWRAFFGRYFGRALWWHPSARADYRFYLVNALVFPLLLGPLLFGEPAVSNMLDAAVKPFLGGMNQDWTPAGWTTKIIYTVAFFLAYDFGRFAAHSLLHDVPLLWEFHKVHHSAEVLTPITSFRAHPIDLAVMAWIPALTTGMVTWVFHRFVDAGIGFHTFLGLHVLIWAFSLVGNLRHWQVWISYGAALNRWLISPAHHQLHHSAEARHWGCNRGFELAIWDRLYGTLYVPANEPESFRMGLGDETDGRWRTLGRMYFWPFVLCFKRWGTRSFIEKNET
jgi:sterol desaturase/sphingolipid hydroxylase (fatty acid hydroxylase superfamily)